MPPLISYALDPGDRKVLLAVGVLFVGLVLATVILAPEFEKPAEGSPTTYSYASNGARAAYLLLKDLGYREERWEQPATELPEDAAGIVLILAEPVFPFSAAETHSLHKFLRAGGWILATGLRSTGALPGETAQMSEPYENEWKKFAVRLASPLTREANTIELKAGADWRMGNPSHLLLYGDGGKGVAVTYQHGEGRVIWWASATPLTNAGISSSDNLRLLLDVMGPPGEKRILWDEYSHGVRGSLWIYFARTPIPWGMAQLALMAIAMLLTFGRRSGPVRPLAVPSRLSPLEFVAALGGLYYRAHAARAAVGVALQRFRFLLARRLGLPGGLATQELARAANQRLGSSAEFLETTLRAAERASFQPHLADAEALELVQTLDMYAERLAIKPGFSVPVRPRATVSADAISSSESHAELKETG